MLNGIALPLSVKTSFCLFREHINYSLSKQQRIALKFSNTKRFLKAPLIGIVSSPLRSLRATDTPLRTQNAHLGAMKDLKISKRTHTYNTLDQNSTLIVRL